MGLFVQFQVSPIAYLCRSLNKFSVNINFENGANTLRFIFRVFLFKNPFGFKMEAVTQEPIAPAAEVKLQKDSWVQCENCEKWRRIPEWNLANLRDDIKW